MSNFIYWIIKKEKHMEIDTSYDKRYKALINSERLSYKENIFLLLMNAIPAYFSLLIEEISSTISISFVGHLDNPDELAAIGISETFTLILFFYPVVSNLGAIDTFVSTSYGNKQFYLCGVYLNRALLILTLFAIPSIFSLFFIEEILLFLGQDPIIAHMSQIYFYYRIPTLVIMLYWEIIRRYFQAMGYFNSLTGLVIIQLISHILFLTIFIYGFEMNYVGAAIAIGWSNLVGLLSIFVYFKFISQEMLHIKF